MFGRLLSKGLKKVSIDSKTSHILLKDTDISLVIMRPYDLVQLGDLVGSGSEDILIWTGKTIGKSLLKNLQENKKIKTSKKLFEELLNNLTNLGYGKFQMDFDENKGAKIRVSSSLLEEIQEKDDRQLICNLYNGIFIGSFNTADIEVDILDIYCPEGNDANMKFEYEFFDLGDEM